MDDMSQQNTTNRKLLIAFSTSIFAYALIFTSCFLCVLLVPKWYGLIIGGVLSLVAIPLHILGKRNSIFYFISIISNFFGCGFSVGAYYSFNKIPPILPQIILVLILVIAFLAVTCFFISYYQNTKIVLFIVGAITFLLLIISLLFWIINGSFVFSFAFFMIIISCFFITLFGVTVENERYILRDLSFTSFCTLIILTIVVAIILSEGDFIDGFDLGGGGKKRLKHK